MLEKFAHRKEEDENRTHLPYHGHDGKSARLKLFLRHQLRHRGAQGAYIATRQASQGACQQSREKGFGEAEQKTRSHGTDQASQDGGFPSKAIRSSAPHDARERLSQREDGRSGAGPLCDLVRRHIKGLDHLREIWKDGSECNRLGKAADCYAGWSGSSLLRQNDPISRWFWGFHSPRMKSCCLGSFGVARVIMSIRVPH